jgi:hypothetical protein
MNNDNLLLRGVRTMKTNLLHHIAIAGTMVYQKADLWHPAFRPSGVMNSDVSEVTETDENILIPNARDAPRLISDDVLERAPPAWEVITEYVATSFVVAVICVTFAFAFVNVMFPGEWALIGP